MRRDDTAKTIEVYYASETEERCGENSPKQKKDAARERKGLRDREEEGEEERA